MKLQKLEDSQTSVYLLPDYVKNNGSKLRFTGAEYEREVILEVTMKYKDVE